MCFMVVIPALHNKIVIINQYIVLLILCIIDSLINRNSSNQCMWISFLPNASYTLFFLATFQILFKKLQAQGKGRNWLKNKSLFHGIQIFFSYLATELHVRITYNQSKSIARIHLKLENTSITQKHKAHLRKAVILEKNTPAQCTSLSRLQGGHRLFIGSPVCDCR